MNYEEIMSGDTPIEDLNREEQQLLEEIRERQIKASLIAKMILLRHINANS